MAADTNQLDYFRAGEPATGLKGKVDELGLDYFRAGEPLNWLVTAGTIVSTDVMIPMGMLGTGRV
jgi:hypothetical protein